MQRVPGLDGVRGLAILAVVTYHATNARFPVGGFFGVDLFFVLSGYLITSILLAEWERVGSIDLGSFYLRRARRLLPGLIPFLLAGLAIAVYITTEGVRGWTWLAGVIASSLYTTNFWAAFDRLGMTDHWLGGLWSLAAEEQFYLVWPFALVFLLRRRRGLIPVLVALLALSVVGFYTIGLTSTIQELQYDPAARSIPIVAGCLLAVAPQVEFHWGLTTGGTLFASACLVCHCVPGALLLFTPIGIAGSMLLISNAHRSRWVLTFPPLMWLGAISYSLYLWHPALLWLLPHRQLLAIAVALGLATVSTVLVENPIRRGLRATPGSTAAPHPAAAQT
jgi:peptidoglycan/LPS O-acetylase OafA/YrhL